MIILHLETMVFKTHVNRNILNRGYRSRAYTVGQNFGWLALYYALQKSNSASCSLYFFAYCRRSSDHLTIRLSMGLVDLVDQCLLD